jgi:hypothetical protein
LVDLLREAADSLYFMHLHREVSPHLFGESVHRPRVFIRLMRTDHCLVDSEQEFRDALDAADKLLAECTSRIVGGGRSAITNLERQGFIKPLKVTGDATGWCPCCMPVLH